MILEPNADLIEADSCEVQQRKVEAKSNCHRESALNIGSMRRNRINLGRIEWRGVAVRSVAGV